MATLKTLVILFAVMVVALAAVPRPKPVVARDVEEIPANSEPEPKEVLKGESSYGFGYGGYYPRYYGGYGGYGGWGGYGYPYYGSYYSGFGYPYYGGYGYGYGGLYGGHWF